MATFFPIGKFDRRRFLMAAGGLPILCFSNRGKALAAPQPRPAELKGRWGVQPDGTFINPIIPADYSDIDVIQVGSRYYAISSTLHMSPGMVVMQSDDLVNWETIAHAISDISPLGLNLTWKEMNGYGRGVWAGALRYHNGLFYLYFTCPDSGVYVTTAKDAKGPWAPLTCLWATEGYDDLCPFWDDDGRAYLIMTRFAEDPVTKITYNVHLFDMASDGLSFDHTKSRIVHRSDGSEANKLDKRNGIYYHYFSEVRPEGRVPMMRRARSLDGPWEERQLGHVEKSSTRSPIRAASCRPQTANGGFLPIRDVVTGTDAPFA